MTMTFKNTGTEWSGYQAAEKWLTENGYSYGTMQAGAPTGIAKGSVAISKWRGIGKSECILLDGQIDECDARNGDVTISLKD